jgi:two-component system chemotaxis sensor kinase CheA
VSTLLEQFLEEARELLEVASGALLALERRPDDRASLDALFRAVHTMKGGAGLFEMPALSRLLHAAEDVLDTLRAGDEALSPPRCDALLACIDRTEAWLAHFERDGALPADADEVTESLRERLGAEAPAAHVHAVAREVVSLASIAPDLRAVAEAALQRGAAVTHLLHRPCEGTYLSGDDPLLRARGMPGLLALRVGLAGDADADPYRCHLVLRAVSDASPEALRGWYAHVAEEVEVAPLEVAPAVSPEDIFTELLRQHAAALRGASPEHLGEVARAAAGALGNALRALQRPADAARVEEAAKRAAEQGTAEGLLQLIDPTPVTVAAEPAVPKAERRTLRVDTQQVDALVRLVGELLIAENALPYLSRQASTLSDGGAVARAIQERHQTLHRVCEGLQSAVMQMRMLPASVVFERFPRLVRDLARRLDKDVALVLEGGDTGMDKDIIDRLADPLLHLVRNALDHGVEPADARADQGKAPQARVVLRAVREGHRVLIEVEDDGRGIDPSRVRARAVARGVISAAESESMTDDDALQLVFAPGFSTAEAVSDISGRGVGMDAARRAVESFGGTLTLSSAPGRGTTAQISAPVTMAVTRTLLVRAGGQRVGVPMLSLRAATRVDTRDFVRRGPTELAMFRERLVSVRRLSELVGVSTARCAPGEAPAVLLRVGARDVLLVVDAIEGTVDVMVKPLSGVLARCRPYAGSALLGDGQVLLILDPEQVTPCPSNSTTAAYA